MKAKAAKPQSLDASTRLFKAFADPVRLRLLNLLSSQQEICVCHLHEALGLPQPTVSRHLAYLRKHGLVVGRKEGLWVHYRLAKPRTNLHRELLGTLTTCVKDLESFQQDRARLARAIPCCDR
jgi:ArsR family transcriptional regulator